MGHKSDTLDAAIARIASRQHGVVTLRQLEGLGLSRWGVSKRAERGRFHRVHRGVYAVGHRAPNLHARFMAAVLACGDGAVLSHGSAAVLWELLKPLGGPIHVSVPTTAGLRSRKGIRVHRCPALAHCPTLDPRAPRPLPHLPSPNSTRRDEPSSSPSYSQQLGGRGGRFTTHRLGIPITTIHRTIEDLERSVPLFPPSLLRRAKRQAELRGIHLIGVDRIRTRSDLEDAFLALWRRHHLPTPETNVKVGRWEVDFLWRPQRLAVEADFFGYHRGSVAFEDDHARDLDLRSEGLAVLRYTDTQVDAEPERIAAEVAAALSAGAALGL